MTFSGGELLTITAAQMALTALPAVASALVARRLGVREVPALLCIALAGSGLSAVLAFWAYYAHPHLGNMCAVAVVLGAVAAIAWCWPAVREDRGLLRELATPLALWALGSTFVIFFGFLHGGTQAPLEVAATRFAGGLPSDNDIPHFFAEWFALHGHYGDVPVYPGEYLSSDRPPLQIGYALAQRTFGWDRVALHYQVLGVLVQQLWIVGLWALLVASRARRATRGLVMAAALFCDVAIVNSFFVWPKLLAASFVIAGLALLASPEGSTLRRQPWTAVLLAVLAGLAYLSHGSAAFGIVPLALIAVYRGLPSWRWVAAAVAAGLVLVVSWSAYQHYGDPPGNRLQKWSLAGVTEIDDRGVLETMSDAYSEAGLGGALHDKVENAITLTGNGKTVEDLGEAIDHASSGDTDTAIAFLRESRFFSLLPSLGLLLIGLPFLAYARARERIEGPDWALAKLCLLFVALDALTAVLLFFGNAESRPVIHVNTMAAPLIAVCGLVAGLRATYPRLAAWLVGLNAATVLLLYTPALKPLAGTGYSLFAVLATALALLGLVYLTLIRESDVPEPSPADAGSRR
jgi:hypothetical protein